MTILEKIGLCIIGLLLSGQCLAFGFSTTISDTIKPVITQEAADLTVECNNAVINQLNIWYNSQGGAMATDNSGNVTLVPDLTFAEAQDSLSAHEGYTCGMESFVTITWVAIDDCNNQSLTSTTATFTTDDSVDPTFPFPATQVVVDCDATTQDSLNNWVENKAGLIAEDDCSDTVIFTMFIWNGPGGSSGQGDFDSPVNIPISTTECNQVYTVSFFAADDCGNSAVTTGSFSINDNEAPVWSMPIVDVTVDCTEAGVPDILGLDDCIGEIVPDVVSISNQGNDPNDCSFYNYTIQRTWTASDACLNIIEDQHQVSVQDLMGPTFTIIDTVDINCVDLDSTFVNYGPESIMDNCSSVEISSNDVQIGQGCNFKIERTWTAEDVCGNLTSKLQVFNITDAAAPEIIIPARDTFISCNNFLNLTSELNLWIANMGYSEVVESCSALNSFAATPGTYDINNPSTDQGFLNLTLVDQGCPSSNSYLSQVIVDFVFYDNCGSAVVSTAIFGIADIDPPVIQNCPADLTIESQGMDCTGLFTLEALDVMDNCGAVESPLSFSLTEPITSPISGDNMAPVDSVLFHIGPINLFNNPANGIVTLDLSVFNIDSGENTEFFIIKGENGVILDSTDVILGIECTDSSYVINNITPAQLNLWGADGFIDIWLVPNLPDAGEFTINDVCGNSSAELSLTFDIDLQNSLEPAYSIDGGDTIQVSLNDLPLDLTLDAGDHTIEYFYFDCTGNVASCSQMIGVIDASAPEITCPDDLTLNLEIDSCRIIYPLSVDFGISDNCGFSTIYNETFPTSFEAALLPFIYDPSLDTFIADNVFFSFDNVNPISQSSTQALLTIDIKGDIDEPGEAYEIFGEGGIFLGTTALNSSAPCDSSSITFPIEQSVFNNWASDGQIIITALAPDDPSISGGGINNCSSIPAGEDSDGYSTIFANLSYADAQVFYSVGGATTVGNTLLYPDGTDTLVLLNGGNNIIEYKTFDDFGNEGVCTYNVFVEDTQDPQITCQDQVIFVHPSGLEDYTLSFQELLADYADNCEIVEYSFMPELLDCSMEGEVVEVLVTATDAQGNSTTCSSQVRVETPVLEPSFTAGICEGDTLKLFANIPPSSVANGYTFSWTGPNGFASNTENPVIPNPNSTNNGTYILEAVGFNGCNSKGTVEVFIQQLTTPEITSDLNIECVGDDLILNATSYTGDVFYLWYEGLPSSGILLQTTTNPSIILNPTLGSHNYYVEVSSPLCSTLPSLPINIEIVEAPVASVTSPFLTLCEGEDIALGTDEFDPSYEYFWTGPDNYMGSGQFPAVIKDVTSVNEGLYNLMISNGACFSDTAITQVVIFPTPETPVISGEDIYCEGSSIVLSVNNVTDADLYSWYLNGNLFIAQASNTLFIPAATANFSGDWTVSITDGLCISDTSAINTIFIENEFQIGISSNSPVCTGDSIVLSASFVPNAQYIWEAPDGEQVQGQSVTLDALEGTYTVSVTTESGCENEESTVVQIDEIPSITALSNNSEACMDGTEDISFFPSVVPPGQYDYTWSGPQNFNPTSINPVITNASSIHNGLYTLIVANGDCISDPEVTLVDITDIPDQPTISVESIYCQDEDFVILTDTVSMGEYQWSTPIGNVITSDPSLEIVGTGGINEGDYSLIINVNGCLSEPSEISSINIQEQPNIPNALSNSPVCTGDTLFFNAIQITDALYEWTGPNNFSSIDKDPYIENISASDAGEYQVRILINGCPSEWNSVTVEVIETPQQPVLVQEVFSICEDASSSVELCLQGSFVEGTENEFFINNQLVSTSSDSCVIISISDINLENTNEITVVSTFMGCRSEISAMSTLNVDAIPTISAQAQNNTILLCDESETALTSLFGPPMVDVSWSSMDDDLIFIDIDELSTVVSSLPSGMSTVFLEYSSGSCMNFSRDTITINNILPPTAVNDTLNIGIDRGESINTLENDEFSLGINLELLQEPLEGSFTIINGFVTYIPDPRYPGEHEVIYEICYQDCPDLCSIASLIINVELPTECIVPNVITPNGDNINDAFIISCFAANSYPDNEVKIFNEWGDEVFSARPYQNDWEGTYNNSELPSGTYFYIVDKGDGSRPENGFVHIEK